MNCKACGAQVPDGAQYCIQCGIHMETGGRADGDAPDSTVYPLLAAANLFRMRGQWDAAEQKCIEVLRLYPNNATAHSLLGDVYTNQGRWADAIQWYELAVDLDPENQADRAKLDQARLSAAGLEPPAAEPQVERTVWPARSGFRVSPLVLWAAIGFLTVVVLLLGLSAMHSRARETMPGSTEITTGPVPPEFEAARRPAPPIPPANGTDSAAPEGSGPAAVGNGEPRPSPAPGSASAAEGNPAGGAAPADGAATLQAPSADMTENEARTLARFQTQMPTISQTGQARLSDVRWDPLYQRAIVTVLFAARLERSALMDEALRGAFRVGQALHRIDAQHFSRCEVLVKAPIGAGGGPDVVFAGEAQVTGTGAWAEDPSTARANALLPAFANVWWHPLLR